MYKRGFTLAELLIVIVIIAILSGVALVFFADVQKTARDTKRRQDLQTLKIAFEAYHQKNHHYPCTQGDWQTSTDAPPWIHDNQQCGGPVFGEDYISKLPQDPINSGVPWFENSEADRKYGYAYWSGPTTGNNCPAQPGQYYILVARFEKSGHKDASPEEIVNLCDGTTPILSIIPAFDYGLNDLHIITSHD